jgi:methyltransferase family protein
MHHGGTVSRTTFSLLRSLNSAPLRARRYHGDSHVFFAKIVARYFATDRLTDRLIRELVHGYVLKWKEILECFEFFDATRKLMRRPCLADVCCGHGLIGILFALLMEEVEQVHLIDARIPDSLSRVLAVATKLGPWVEEKVTVHEMEVEAAESILPSGAAIVCAHGCGVLTDQALDLAMRLQGPVAVMPCCCHPRRPDTPQVLYQELGVKDGVDVHRTYQLHDAGYQVLWRYVPEDITPMNRIIVGARKD